MSKCPRICGAYLYRLSKRKTTVILLVSFILCITVILQLYAYKHAGYPHLERIGDFDYQPGAFLKGQQPNENISYCQFQHGFPDDFNLNNTPVSFSPGENKRSRFKVIYNAIIGTAYANLSEYDAVTYATQATPEFMYHIVEIARYWDGPISLAVYVPDYDLELAMKIMTHLCSCYHGMSKVSMHLFFDNKYIPKIRSREELARTTTEAPTEITTTMNISAAEIFQKKLQNYRNLCNNSRAEYIIQARRKKIQSMTSRMKKAPFNIPNLNFQDCMGPTYLNVPSFRREHGLLYPINVGRNVARNASKTNYFLVSDIELVPSEGLAPKFLTMMRKLMGDKKREEGLIVTNTIFVVPLFEVERSVEIPRDKDTLVRLIAANRAVYFHQKICPHCQRFPGLQTWLTHPSPPGLEPVAMVRREYPYHRWEPLYFGTQNEPWYSEVLTWEGRQDKMTQMLELCLQEYRMVVIDGGFLCHASIRQKKDLTKRTLAEKRNYKKYKDIIRLLKMRYKHHPKCKAL